MRRRRFWLGKLPRMPRRAPIYVHLLAITLYLSAGGIFLSSVVFLAQFFGMLSGMDLDRIKAHDLAGAVIGVVGVIGMAAATAIVWLFLTGMQMMVGIFLIVLALCLQTGRRWSQVAVLLWSGAMVVLLVVYGVAGQRLSWSAIASIVVMLLLVIVAVTLPGARRHFRERVALRRAARSERRQARLQRRMARAGLT